MSPGKFLAIADSRPLALVSDRDIFLLQDRLPTFAEIKNEIAPIDLPVEGSGHTVIRTGDFSLFRITQPSNRLTAIPIRKAFDLFPSERSAQLVTALQILNWLDSVQFCAKCGGKLHRSTSNTNDVDISQKIHQICKECEASHYPQLQPVVITLVKREKKILLARALPPRTHYSCIAGFVEPGESLEGAVAREVKEETNLDITNIRYFGSQTWPFPSQMMIGFTADWANGEIRLDPTELSDGGWYSLDQLPELPPSFSLARHMIDAHLKTGF